MKKTLGLLIAGLAVTGSAQAAIYALDFGTGNGAGPVFTGTFDGTSGFAGYELTTNTLSPESPSIAIGGGVTLEFTNVGGWNNSNNDVATTSSLGDDHLFSSGNGADENVNFTFSGLNATDILQVELLDRFGAANALVTFNGGTPVLVDNDAAFTDVSGGGVTGSTSYSGSFTGGSGSGEGNLAGARITVTPVPEPASLALLGLGGLVMLSRRRRA